MPANRHPAPRKREATAGKETKMAARSKHSIKDAKIGSKSRGAVETSAATDGSQCFEIWRSKRGKLVGLYLDLVKINSNLHSS